ncbi:nucleotidyltransferase domain-containing protein [Parvularcula sp. LCG005]|uniref:[protein-PII] uridylyltransferase family protein n=1 Tax=Parvularcula sp. LCG005 TaxID=3078805 RepID=UPI0029430049|nr:nucleotidyltransferase domain-containing protein [Parvularcula sp. LCG005]WOI53596.1 hypothetical protein RUI03_01045 [Parvularcula sp. LCG005]
MTNDIPVPAELVASITAVKEAGGASSDFGTILRRHWSLTKSGLFQNYSRGRTISECLSDCMDGIVATLADAVCDERTAILATGGYGRGQLAPFSDIDLLILMGGRNHQERLAPFLYAMWDGSFLISHSTHTPASAIQACGDYVTRTAFLDARLVWGSRELADDFQGRFDRLRRKTVPEFVSQKLKEQDDRHDRDDASRYAIEPDVKEGKGALRDLDTLHWLDRYVAGIDTKPDQDADLSSLFSSREVRRLKKIQDFFWSVRVHLHDIMGRKDEKLRFSVQPKVAARLGYTPRGRETAVERFMRHYFLNAKEVGKLTGAACAQLESRAFKEARLSRRVAGAVGRMTQEQPFDGEDGLVLRGGRLNFVADDAALVSNRDVFALFRAAGRHNVEIHPQAIQIAFRVGRKLGQSCRSDAELATIFRDILRESISVERTLRAMTEAGVLGRYIPAFGGVIGSVEYGLFRLYTLEEHILRSTGVLSDMLHDRDDGRFKLTKPMAKALDDPTPLYLALLLQEADAGLGDHSRRALKGRVVEQARRILDTDDKVQDVVFAVLNRDLLVRTASRRNVIDMHLLEKLCTIIDSEKKLALLAIATSCRHRTAGLRSWEEYAKRDVKLLVELIRAYQSGGEEHVLTVLSERQHSLRAQARAMLPPDQAETFDGFLERTGPTFWSMADVAAAADLALLVDRVDRTGATGGAVAQPNPGGTLQVIVYGDDRSKLFADCAGIVAEIGGTVFGSSAFPLGPNPAGVSKGVVIFQINRAGSPVQPFEASTEECLDIAARFEQVACRTGPPPRLPAPVIGDRRSVFHVEPIVRIDNDSSEDSLIVEVEALDRPGLLYSIAGGLAEIGVSVQLAFVSTYGHVAVDTFYLQDAPRYKITDERRIEAIRRQIIRVLEAT